MNNSLQLVLLGVNAFSVHPVPQEVHAVFQEFALSPVYVHTVPQEVFQGFVEMLQVLLVILSSEDDVINVAGGTLDSLENSVHGSLENGWSGGDTKWKLGVLIQSLMVTYFLKPSSSSS